MRHKILITLRGPSAEGDAVASTSGPAHKRFLETRAEKIQPRTLFNFWCKVWHTCTWWSVLCVPVTCWFLYRLNNFCWTPPPPYSYITVYTQLKILIETSCEIHEICNIHITFCGQSFSDGSLSLSLSLSLAYRTINPIIPELSITLQHCWSFSWTETSRSLSSTAECHCEDSTDQQGPKWLLYGKLIDFYRPPLWSNGQSFWLQIQRSRVRFPALPDLLSSSGSGTGSTQPHEVNWGATWIKSSGSGPENRD